jgi:cytoskeletal protein CcmA (bactofilin family)
MPERGGAAPPELVLAEGMSFAGLLVLPNDARIDGRIAGEVLASGSVEVGATGVVEADLEVSDVVVHGRVMGGIRARRSISLEPGAVVEGDIRAPHLSMAEGARVDGLCHCGAPAEDDAISREHAAPRLDPSPSAS